MAASSTAKAESSHAEPPRPGLLGQLWQQRLAFTLTFVVSVGTLVALWLMLPVSYVATGSLIVADREPNAATASDARARKGAEPVDTESVVLLVRSPRLLRTLVAKPGIPAMIGRDCVAGARQIMTRWHRVDCSQLLDDAEAQLAWIQDRLVVGTVGQSRVIGVGYRSPSPAVAQAMVNALLDTFLEDERTTLHHSRDEVTDWLRARLAKLDGELATDTAAVEAFRNRHGLVRGVDGVLGAEQLSQAALQLAAAKTALADAEARMQDARSGGGRQAQDSRTLAELKQQSAQASAQAASAALRFGAQNPQLLAFKRQEAEAAARLAAETGRAGDLARRTLEAAKQRLEAAQAALNEQTQAAKEAADAESQLAGMVRDLENKRATGLDLSQRLSQLETERRMLEPNTRLMNMAELPARPAFPQRLPFVFGGLALSTVLATAAGLLTYRPPQSGSIALGRTYTRIPILAQVPELRLRRTGKREVARNTQAFPFAAALSLLESHPPLLESIRILHARLALAGFGTKKRTLLVASEVSGEGKSFVTLALARMARASGQRVLVIETCLREPFLEEALHVPPSAGLSGFLRGGAAETVRIGAVPGVDFMLAGGTMGDSTELLSGPRFRALLEWVSVFDLVLIDSPPVAELMDAALIAPLVDGVVFCLRAGRPPAKDALNSLPEIQRANGNVVGLALTFVPDERVTTPGVGPARIPQRQRQLAPTAG